MQDLNELYRVLGRIEALQTAMAKDISEIKCGFDTHEQRISSLEHFKIRLVTVVAAINAAALFLLDYLRSKLL